MLLKKAITGLIAGVPIGAILYATFGLINSAIGSVVINEMVGLALGVSTSVGLQFVQDLKE